jgi:hypothetical protein
MVTWGMANGEDYGDGDGDGDMHYTLLLLRYNDGVS